jgi:hypothetical protein
MRRSLIALLIGISFVACDDDPERLSPTGSSPVAPRGPSGPTPGGEPFATEKMILYIIPPCASNLSASGLIADLFRSPIRKMVQESSRVVDRFKVMELTTDGQLRERELNTLVIGNIPRCLALLRNEFGLVITAERGNLMNAIQLEEELEQHNEQTWSGSLMWVMENTLRFGYVTSGPFKIGQTDRFSFPAIMTNGTIDMSLELQPGAPRAGKPERIRVRLNALAMEAPGYDGRLDVSTYRMRGTLPSPR